MFNLDTLDTLIAIVIVLLVLSLVVQAIQSALKKLFKIKSRQLEESLIDLFENVFDPPQSVTGNGSSKSKVLNRYRLPILQLFRRGNLSDLASSDVKKVFNEVMKNFQDIGRVATSGRRMLDSISKEDLMKVLRKVAPDTLLPNSSFLKQLQKAYEQIIALKGAIEDINKKPQDGTKPLGAYLSGEASAKFAKMREAVTPLINDLESIGTSGTLNPNLLLADVMNLREVKLDDVLDLLGEVQKKVGEDLAAAPADSDDKKKLKELDDGLKNIATTITNIRQEFDAALAPLRVKLREVENWYDTVMQSFEERYNRGMKTWAFVISLAVAICLNANMFDIYRTVSTNDTIRNTILSSQEEVLKRYEAGLAEAKAISAPEAEQKKLQELVNDTRKTIKEAVADYAKFGFRDLRQEFDYSSPGREKWNGYDIVAHIFLALLGWLITAALLSIGAPFWHDTLESLFGLKNLLRKRGDIRNVETKAGAGQPQT